MALGNSDAQLATAALTCRLSILRACAPWSIVRCHARREHSNCSTVLGRDVALDDRRVDRVRGLLDLAVNDLIVQAQAAGGEKLRERLGLLLVQKDLSEAATPRTILRDDEGRAARDRRSLEILVREAIFVARPGIEIELGNDSIVARSRIFEAPERFTERGLLRDPFDALAVLRRLLRNGPVELVATLKTFIQPKILADVLAFASTRIKPKRRLGSFMIA